MRVLSFFLVLAATHVYSQTVDVTGRWAGTANSLGSKVLIEYELTQRGLLVEGFGYTWTMNGKDSSKYSLNGTISGKKIELRGTDFIYRKGINCLPNIELAVEKEGNTEKLVGRWKGDFSLSTCPPGVSGKVEVARVMSRESSQSTETVAALQHQQIHAEDLEGNALVSELSKRKYYALIIGIDSYKDEGIESLDNPVRDATQLIETLQQHYTFDEGNIKLLANPSRSQIIEQFDSLSYKITDRDQLLVFYAGHGIWDERLNQGFWLPSDAKLNSKAQWLSNSTIRDYIGGINAKHTLLITDACFSGSIFKQRAVFAESKAMLEMYKLPSRKAMTSGALKTVPDKSVFLQYLNKYLIENHRPLISAEELFRSFKTAVINNSTNGQVPQYGPIGQVGDEGGDFIFLRKK